MPQSRSAIPAIIFLFVAALAILALNAIPAFGTGYHAVHLINTATVIVCMVPMFRFLLAPKETIPFFEFICILYAVHYAIFPFLSLAPWRHFTYLTHDDLVPAALLTLAGVTAMVLGYTLKPVLLFLRFVPPPRLAWRPASARRVAIAFMALGVIGIAALKTGRSFSGGAQLVVFASNLGVVGILAFWMLQMRGQLGKVPTLALWLGYVPLFVLLAISGGNSAPIALLLMALFMLYIGEKRRIPWAMLIVGTLVLFPFMYAKYEYRDLVWDHGRANFASVDEAMSNVLVFTRLAGEFATDFRLERIGEALHMIFIRFDISYIFAHVMQLTPSTVPYIGGESYSDVFWKVVPRLIYPDKPDPAWGQNFGHMYYILAANDLTTSINFPQLIEMYVNFGPVGVVIGMFLLAQVYRTITYFLNSIGVGDWMTVFATAIFVTMFRVESNFSLVVAGILYHVILIYVIGFFIRSRPPRRYAIAET